MTTAIRTNPSAEGARGRRRPDAPPTLPGVTDMRDCLLRIRDRACISGRRQDVAEIDAVLAGDDEAQIRILVGGATVTPRQRDILAYVWRYRREHGMSPTLQEIGENNGVSKVTAMEHLDELQRKGVIVRDRHKTRSVLLLNELEPFATGGPCGKGE